MTSYLKLLTITFFLCVVPALAAAADFPLKQVPQLKRLVDYEASWSPDGRFIVLPSNRHGGLKVHILDATSEQGGSDMRARLQAARTRMTRQRGCQTAARSHSFVFTEMSPISAS